MFACYVPIGGGIMLLCQLAVTLPCTLIILCLLATSRTRRRHPKYWLALASSAQPMLLMLVLRQLGQSSPHFCTIWLVSMALVPVGFFGLVIWPNRDETKPPKC
jgi:hypothetical protein